MTRELEKGGNLKAMTLKSAITTSNLNLSFKEIDDPIQISKWTIDLY